MSVICKLFELNFLNVESCLFNYSNKPMLVFTLNCINDLSSSFIGLSDVSS